MIIAMKVDSGKAQILTIIGYYRFMRQYNARKQIGKGERIMMATSASNSFRLLSLTVGHVKKSVCPLCKALGV